MPASMKPKEFRLLTAEQCAARRGVTLQRWNEMVADEPIPPLFTTDGVPQWAPWQVPARPKRTAAARPARLPTTVYPDGLWTLAQAAHHAGLTRATFRGYAHAGTAPAPVAKRGGRHPVWDPHKVRAYATSRRIKTGVPAPPEPFTPTPAPPEPQPDALLWTARESASHHGISTRTWHCAVAHGDAPGPIATRGKRTPLWSAEAVRNTTI